MPELARLAQPAFSRAHDRFGAIGNLELAENVRNVIAHRLRAQTQAIGNGGVIYSLSNQSKHFTLALTQLWKCMCGVPERGTAKKSTIRRAIAGLKMASPCPTARIERRTSSSSASFST